MKKQLRQRFSWTLSVVGFSLLVLVLPLASAKPGNYATFDILRNKRLADYLEKVLGVMTVPQCKSLCVKNKRCEAFAISTFERACQLYELVLGTPPVNQVGYTLYIRKRTEEEGYYMSGMNYIKLMVDYQNFFDAKETCEEMKGTLVADKNDDVNDLLKRLMVDHSVFKAYIGIRDEEKEGEWRFMDKSLVKNPRWDYNGEWYRRDKNCAYIDIVGNWFHINCKNPLPFFCQIPMF